MASRFTLAALILTLLGFQTIEASEYSPSPVQQVSYHGIRPGDPNGRDGLRNPERALRIETLIAEPEGAQVWGPAHHLIGKVPSGYTDQWWILDAGSYERHGLTLAQTYCYLDGFVGKPLSNEKLALLQRSLDNLRKHGLKAVLRFAYEKDMNRSGGPTVDDILAHIDQLAPVIRKNVDVIYVMQAGFVGAWGEWHSSTHGLEKDHAALARIIARVLDVLPAERMTQVRVPKYKRWVLTEPTLGGFEKLSEEIAYSSRPAARIGFHNDGFLAGKTCGGTWTEPPLFSNPGNPEFDYMTDESPYVAIDGELFWADQGGEIEGLRAAVRMRLHHYSSFSLAHSFSDREGKPFSIDTWMKTPLTIEDVRTAKLPVSDGYFEGMSGERVPRTQFEYIRDHLGYRLEMQRAIFPAELKPGGVLTVQLELVNRGFSTLINPRKVYILLISANEEVTEFLLDVDPRRWQPWAPGDAEFKPIVHQVNFENAIPSDLPTGVYSLALLLPDPDDGIRLDPRYAVRLSNRDTPWWTNAKGEYGANVFGTVHVK